jgi:hypothetical protein
MSRVNAREDLRELRGKYAEMLSMRQEHARGGEEEAHARARARKRMAELAARFPGALREIDDLELGTIRTRIAALDAAARGEGPSEPWMEAMARFHSLARGALCAKRWLAGRKQIDGAVARAFAQEARGLPFPLDAQAWTADLARVAAPPRGRIMDMVFARLAVELGTSERDARRLIFGAPRRRQSATAPRPC